MDNFKAGKVTIQEVAKEAGVSITTVSRVINNNYPVKETTRKKVEDAIKKLDFSPNLLARGLINNKTFTLGVLVPSIANVFFPIVVKGIESVAKQEGYTILLSDTEGKPSEEKKIIKALMDRCVDGIIVIDPRKDNLINGYYDNIAKMVPTVLINGYNRGIHCNFILNDQEMGTIEALTYLINMGHKNIAFLRGDNSYSYDIKEAVYYEHLKNNNIEINKNNILRIKDGNSIQTTELAKNLVIKRLKENDPPTAILACNDSMAVGVLHAAKRLNLNVPNDLSIIGYDNTILSQLSEPRLTTVDQNMFKLGKLAAQRLYEIIQSKETSFTKVVVETTLILRNSVGKLNK